MAAFVGGFGARSARRFTGNMMLGKCMEGNSKLMSGLSARFACRFMLNPKGLQGVGAHGQDVSGAVLHIAQCCFFEFVGLD